MTTTADAEVTSSQQPQPPEPATQSTAVPAPAPRRLRCADESELDPAEVERAQAQAQAQRPSFGPDDEIKDLIAYELHPQHGRLVPAPVRRAWMDVAATRHPQRCLPMLIANQSGWHLLAVEGFEAEWNGGPLPSDVRLTHDTEAEHHQAMSHFGLGIVTLDVSMLIRTPPGWNLLVRGPANLPKDGVSPLEGVVETDWAVATFTMNWKLTRPGLPVRFEAGEPICLLVPQRRGELESFRPRLEPAEAMTRRSAFEEWSKSRLTFNAADNAERRRITTAGWERHYMLGTDPRGARTGWRFPEHQRRLALHPFTGADSDEESCQDPPPPA